MVDAADCGENADATNIDGPALFKVVDDDSDNTKRRAVVVVARNPRI